MSNLNISDLLVPLSFNPNFDPLHPLTNTLAITPSNPEQKTVSTRVTKRLIHQRIPIVASIKEKTWEKPPMPQIHKGPGDATASK